MRINTNYISAICILGLIFGITACDSIVGGDEAGDEIDGLWQYSYSTEGDIAYLNIDVPDAVHFAPEVGASSVECYHREEFQIEPLDGDRYVSFEGSEVDTSTIRVEDDQLSVEGDLFYQRSDRSLSDLELCQ